MDLSPLTYYGSFNHIPFSLLLSGRGQVTGAVRSPRNLAMGRPVCSVMTDAAVKGTEITERVKLAIVVRFFPSMLWTYDSVYPGNNHCPFISPQNYPQLPSWFQKPLSSVCYDIILAVFSFEHMTPTFWLLSIRLFTNILRESQGNVSVWSCSLMVTWLLWMHKA